MKLNIILSLTFLLIGHSSFAARVAVTDSGTDFSHEWLAGRELLNTNEVAGNRVDDDRNGKVDDIMGWNFADNYGRVFFKEHVADVDPQVYVVMEILSRMQSGTQTKEDEKYWKENIVDLAADKKQKLVAGLNAYGQYSHSTHVSGIIASVSPEARMMSNRVFPDAPLSFYSPLAVQKQNKGVIDYLYKLIATLSNGTFDSAAKYIAERQIDVANYSMGVSMQTIANLGLVARGIKKPTPEQIAAETMRLYTQYEPLGKKWLQSASKTLFVVASGNDGADNDKMPTFPGNVEVDNSISVGASQGVNSLAKFSNYGATSVDIAAPGVAIVSSVPSLDNKKVLPMSGTSMAAPYVAGVAARMKDINPKLTPAQMKQILMGTVDKKDWLKGKVVSAGVVNQDRAYAASENSKSMTLASAMEASIKDVPDQIEANIPKRLQKSNEVTRDMTDFANQVLF